MNLDIATLAANSALLLAPFMPYLLKGGKAAAKAAFEHIGEKFVDAEWEQADTLFQKIWPKANEKQTTKAVIEEAAKDIKNDPHSQDARDILRLQFKKLLADDEELAESINNIYIRGNVINSTVIAGTGNILIQGNVYIGPTPRNPQDALKIYREVVAISTANLPMRGIDLEVSDPTSAQKPIGLAHVYVALDTTMLPKEELEKLRKDRDALRLVKLKPVSALNAVIQNCSVVIKGNPGSGKSTFVNYLANCLAVQNTSALIDWDKNENNLLPVIIILRDFAKSLPKKLPAQAEPRHLCDFLSSRLKAQNLQASTKPIFEMLEDGKAILFFDGLDEVPTREQRVFVRDAVQTFVNRYSKNRFLVTCRVLSYQPPKSKNEPDLRLANFPEFELAPFDEEKITAFIDGWYEELSNLSIVTAEDAKDLIQRLKAAVQRPELSWLAPNPLLLTVMALVNTHKGRLPDARAVLYEETIDILLWRWEQGSKGQEARLRKLLLEAHYQDKDLEQVIWQLAYEAHEQTSADDENDSLAGISELKLQKVLAEKNNGDLNWAAQIIETMKLRAGLLLERDTGVFTFPHRSFQEYLAATYLDAQDDFVERAKKLAANLPIWREVILWAVSRRVYVRGSISGPLALVAELCPLQISNDPNGWSNTWLAGDILLEIGLNRIQNSELGKELLPRVQSRLVSLLEQNALAPRERSEAGDTLAGLGEPRAGVTHDFVFCEIPAGKFLMGSNKKDDKDAYEDEEPQFEYDIKQNYYLARYPTTNAQFDLFVNDPKGYTNGKWYTEAGKKWRKETKQDKPPKSGARSTCLTIPL